MATFRKEFYSLLAGICIITGGFTNSSIAGHIHNNHPTTPHGGGESGFGWVRIGEIEEFPEDEPDVQVTSSTTEYLISPIPKFTNPNCVTTKAEVEQIVKKTESYTATYSNSITPSAEWAAGALFVKLKASIQYNFTWTGAWTDTDEVTYSIKFSTPLPQCKSTRALATVTRQAGTGSILVWDHKMTCEAPNGDLWYSYCNKQTISITGVGYSESNWVFEVFEDVPDCDCEEEEEEEEGDEEEEEVV